MPNTNTSHLDEVPIIDNYGDENEEDEEDRARRRNHIVYTVALYYCFISVVSRKQVNTE